MFVCLLVCLWLLLVGVVAVVVLLLLLLVGVVAVVVALVPFPTLSPSLIGHPASVDVKQHKRKNPVSDELIVQELSEGRGGRPGLSVLTSLLVSVDVKLY